MQQNNPHFAICLWQTRTTAQFSLKNNNPQELQRNIRNFKKQGKQLSLFKDNFKKQGKQLSLFKDKETRGISLAPITSCYSCACVCVVWCGGVCVVWCGGVCVWCGAVVCVCERTSNMINHLPTASPSLLLAYKWPGLKVLTVFPLTPHPSRAAIDWNNLHQETASRHQKTYGTLAHHA